MSWFGRPGIASALILCLAVGSARSAPPRKSSSAAALAVFQRVERTMIGLRTYQADCIITYHHPGARGEPGLELCDRSHLDAAKPNRMRYELRHTLQGPGAGKWVALAGQTGITFVCDGKVEWEQFGATYRVSKYTAPEYLHTIVEPWEGFYSLSGSELRHIEYMRKSGGLREIRMAGTERVDGVLCDKVFVHTVSAGGGGGSQEYWETWSIGRDGLVRRRAERIAFGGKVGYTRIDTVHNIRLNRPIPASRFVYKPPKGVKLEVEEPRTEEPPTAALLANGTTAPPFAARDVKGEPVKLGDFAGKVVVLDFWTSWSEQSIAAMPHYERVAGKLQAEGLPVVLLAVDNGEGRYAFNAWAKRDAAKFPALRFLHVPAEDDISGTNYHVSATPTLYVLDASGVIRASFVGYAGPTDDLEKAIRAALPHKD